LFLVSRRVASSRRSLRTLATVACAGGQRFMGLAGLDRRPGSCSNSYAASTTVTLTAQAVTGETFTGWSGSGCSGTGNGREQIA
jgi:hypothetical protein